MCPVCNEALVTFELEGVETDSCLTCGGTWLDAGGLEQIAGLDRASVGKISEALKKGRGEKHGKRRCVRCGSKLQIITINGVELDRCSRGHGLWFDRGEIKTVISSFAEGEEGAVARFFGELFRSELETDKRKED